MRAAGVAGKGGRVADPSAALGISLGGSDAANAAQAASSKEDRDPSTRVSRAGDYAREPSLAQDDSSLGL